MSVERPFVTMLPDRGLVHVSGPDAGDLLENTITNAMSNAAEPGQALHAGLLTPQGKILFAFFVVALEDGYLLDTEAESTAGLIQRLSMYRLRAKADIENVSGAWTVGVCDPAYAEIPTGALAMPDPRDARLGHRVYALAAGDKLPTTGDALAAYHDTRIACGIADAGADYALGETFTHEANWDEIGSVDFGKGCFVGQEVVSRTRHKTLVRKRIVKVSATHQLVGGAEVKAGEAVIGTVTSVSSNGRQALAMLRIDRALNAIDQGKSVQADGHDIAIDPARLEAYRAGLASKTTETAAT